MSRQATFLSSPREAADRPSGRRGPSALLAAVVTAALGATLAFAPQALAADDPAPGTIGGAPSAAGSDSGSGSSSDSDESTLTWSVRPTPREEGDTRPNYLLDVAGGDVVEDSIRIRNFGKTELPLTIYASDAITTATGAIDLLPAGETPNDVGSWIELDESELRVPPGEHIDVPFTMTVPSNAESGDHVGGIVTSFLSSGQDDDGQPVKLDRRLGTRVQVRVAGDLRPGLTITQFDTSYGGTANPAGRGDMTVNYTVTNTGNVRMSALQTFSVGGLFGLTGKTADLVPMPELLPGNSLTMTSKVTGVWPILRSSGELEVRPVPTRPGDNFPALKSANASASTWTIPWTLVFLLLLGAAGTSATILARRELSRREAARVDQAVQETLAVHGVTGSQA